MSIDQPRTPAGSPTGGQFLGVNRPEASLTLVGLASGTTGVDRPESDVGLDDRPARLLDDTDPDIWPRRLDVAVRNHLEGGPRWLYGVADTDVGQAIVVLDDGTRRLVPASDVVVSVGPGEYDGDDVDTVADAFGWSPDDIGKYYDAREAREQQALRDELHEASTVDGIRASIEALSPADRDALLEQLAASPATRSPDGNIRAVVSTSSMDVSLDDDEPNLTDHGAWGALFHQQGGVPDLDLEYGDDGALVTRATFPGGLSTGTYFDETDGVTTEVFYRDKLVAKYLDGDNPAPGYLMNAPTAYASRWSALAYRRAAQAESAVRYASLNATKDAILAGLLVDDDAPANA